MVYLKAEDDRIVEVWYVSVSRRVPDGRANIAQLGATRADGFSLVLSIPLCRRSGCGEEAQLSRLV